jgi:hypothetical protein
MVFRNDMRCGENRNIHENLFLKRTLNYKSLQNGLCEVFLPFENIR